MEKASFQIWKRVTQTFYFALICSISSQSFAANVCSQVFEKSAAASSIAPESVKNDLLQRWAMMPADQKEQIQKIVTQRLMNYLMGVSKISPLQLMQQKNVRPDQILDLSEGRTTLLEKDILFFLAQKVETNSLEVFLKGVAEQALQVALTKPQVRERLSKVNEQQKAYALTVLAEAIKSTVRLRGLTSDSKIKYVEWADYSKIVSEVVKRIPGKTTEEKLVNASESEITHAKEVRLLVDGNESFPLREELMSKASKSIDVMSWAIYDDKTGASAADILIQKHKAGIAVRVVVDGQISMRPGYGAEVTRLEKAGVPVIRWQNPARKFEGQHRKLMIIDGEHIIAGGLNFGDVYSHKNPESAQWRDTDIYMQGGTAALDAQNLFAKVWDSQIKAQSLKHTKYKKIIPKDLNTENLGPRVIVIDSRPSDHKEASPILKTLLTAIREAKDSIDIENAYIILFPVLKDELAAAVQRHVQVRVLTNSTKSIDEPIMALPILRSAKDLASHGVQIYLKHGDTLHSKFAVIDGKITIVKSYNIHPRSERVEEEMAIVVLDEKLSQHVTSVFEQDIKTQADFVPSAEHIQLPFDPTSLLGLRIFFDQL